MIRSTGQKGAAKPAAKADPLPAMEVLARIEGKLDALIAALAEDEEPAAVDLDGNPIGDERPEGMPL